ncbi:MAG: DUF2092 domain-containing protein [Variovorax sp.]|nr:MAG: DUF2092 domain-containing protein [Variovorax sp.]
MKSTMPFLGWLLSFSVAMAAALPTASLAQPGEVDADAVQLLRRSTDYVAGMKQFRVDTDATIEVVTSSGQKLQFGQRVAITVQRPNRMRAERLGELVNQTFYYDGEALSVNLPDYKYYATAKTPPTIEAMLDFARDQLDVIAPASDLIYKNVFERLTEGLTSAYVVGKAVIGGVPCDHIAFRNEEVDWQIWIQEGDKPLPRKYIVTSKRMTGAPQFVVVTSKWDPAPKITDATFKFVPPKGSRQIEFIPATTAKK